MGCKQEVKQVQLEAAEITWGKSACRKIVTVADETDSLDGVFVTLKAFNPEGEEVSYVIGKGADAGEGEINVEFLTGSSAEVVAQAFVDAINGIEDRPFIAELEGSTIHALNRFRGKVQNESMGDTGFDYELEIEGVLIDMGSTEGAVELSLEVNLFDVTTNQTGELVIDQIYQGASASISADFLEVTRERFDTLIGEVTGDSVTPENGEKVSGFGQSRLFQTLRGLGGQLVLHPIRLPKSDRSRDVTFWNSAPIVNGLNFDGTAPQALQVEFNAYLESRKDERINLWAKGDWTQEGLDA